MRWNAAVAMPDGAALESAHSWRNRSHEGRHGARTYTALSRPPAAPSDRLDSWKDIAAYLHRDVSTVQRWEKREGMPVHRHVHEKLGTVYAFRSELDAWWRGRGACRPSGTRRTRRDRH